MGSIIITYRYSNLDNRHEYGMQIDSLSISYINWIWFGIGQILPFKTKFEIYPYLIEGKIIYSSILNTYKTSADVVGRRIAKKILSHYAKVKK